MIDARDTALIFEGGGTRNSYTAPVVEKLIAEDVQFGWVGGISAGSVHALNFASRDTWRSENAFTEFVGNPKFGGWRSVVRGKGLINGEWAYEQSEDALPFDFDAFSRTTEEVHVEAVRADTGETVAFNREDLRSLDDVALAARTSSTLPILMKMRKIDGVPYVDGALGTSGGLLIDAARAAGYTRFLAVLTRPRDYVKGPQKRERAVRRILRSTPKVADAMVARPGIYNAAKQSLIDEADAGNAYMFFPEAMGVESTELDAEKLRANYAAGQEQIEREWPAMREFLTRNRGR